MTKKLFDHYGVNLCMSLVLHGVIAMVVFGVFFVPHRQTPSLSQHSLSAHLTASPLQPSLRSQSLSPHTTKPTHQISTDKKPTQKSIPAIQHTSTTHQSTTKAEATTAPSSSALSSKDINALTQYLYQRIATHAHYPASAPRQYQHHSVVLRFMIYPDGHVEKLTIVSSSGLNVVDQSAIQAVEQSAPFSKVSHWLHSPENFILRVRFV